MSATETLPAVQDPNAVSFSFENKQSFDHVQRVARMFSQSMLVPEAFRGDQGMANCVIALNMAKRMGADPLAVMQNLYIVHGKPSWSSQFIISCINTCGRYSPLRFSMAVNGDDRTCSAWCIEKATGEKLEGPEVSLSMAKAEGWYGKNGSKWKTIPDLMLRYRAATFFGRLYAPELLMGMRTVEEAADIGPVIDVTAPPIFSRPAKEGSGVGEQQAPAEVPGGGTATPAVIPTVEPAEVTTSAQMQAKQIVESAGYTWEQTIAVLQKLFELSDRDAAAPDFVFISDDLAARIVRTKRAVLNALAVNAGGAK